MTEGGREEGRKQPWGGRGAVVKSEREDKILGYDIKQRNDGGENVKNI